MIIAVNYTPLDLKIKTAETRKLTYDIIKNFIRKSFDNASDSLEAESLIAVAKERGFHELALEMESDLHIELLEV